MNRAKKRNGFTLVELIVVIAILAILATVGIQIFSGIQDNATRTAAMNDALELAEAINMWITIMPIAVNEGSGETPEDGVLYPKDVYKALKSADPAVNKGVRFPSYQADAGISNLKNARAARRAFDNIYYDSKDFIFKVRDTIEVEYPKTEKALPEVYKTTPKDTPSPKQTSTDG